MYWINKVQHLFKVGAKASANALFTITTKCMCETPSIDNEYTLSKCLFSWLLLFSTFFSLHFHLCPFCFFSVKHTIHRVRIQKRRELDKWNGQCVNIVNDEYIVPFTLCQLLTIRSRFGWFGFFFPGCHSLRFIHNS